MVFAFCTILLQFLNKKIILQSNRKVTLHGIGYPVVFSSGLMNLVPTSFYSSLINEMNKKNMTILSIDDGRPLYKNDVEDIADAIHVDQVGFLSHSLFDPKVFESKRIKSGVFCDPINIPFRNKRYNPKFSLCFIKAQKLYKGDIFFPDFLDPFIIREVETIFYENIGHTDILDDLFASFSKWTGFWDTADPIPKRFHEWTYKDKYSRVDRSKYRRFIANSVINTSQSTEYFSSVS